MTSARLYSNSGVLGIVLDPVLELQIKFFDSGSSTLSLPVVFNSAKEVDSKAWTVPIMRTSDINNYCFFFERHI